MVFPVSLDSIDPSILGGIALVGIFGADILTRYIAHREINLIYSSLIAVLFSVAFYRFMVYARVKVAAPKATKTIEKTEPKITEKLV